MPVPQSLARDTSVTGPIGSLALSLVRPGVSSLALRAVRWNENLQRLGISLPLFLVHDVGLLFATPREQFAIGPRAKPEDLGRAPQAAHLLKTYGEILDELKEGAAARAAGQLKLSDDLVVAILARLFGAVAARLGGSRPSYQSAVPVDATLFEELEPQLPPMFAAMDRSFEIQALEALEAVRLFVLTVADAIDLDTLQLFGMLGSEASDGALSQVDLIAALESPEANDIVNFSLEILPSVLETRTRPAAGTTASHGYSGLGTKGSIDSMVLTELAWEDEELARRIADNEVLYFSREQSRDEQRRIHYLLVDASASMRGERTTFARGMALATGKKLLLQGEDVAFRFFDSRLYELARAKGDRLPTSYILSFKGERGRNPARVFAELATDLEIAKHRDARTPVVHLFTHAALYIPRDLVQAVRALAHIAGVFILPSGGKLMLDYLDLLSAHWVVDHATLSQREARNDAARSILGAESEVGRTDAEAVSMRSPPSGRQSVRPPPSVQSPPKPPKGAQSPAGGAA